MKLSRLGKIERLVSQDPLEFRLRHLFFDAERGNLVASNGRALMICECQAEDGDVSGLIPVEAIERYREFRQAKHNLVKVRAYPDRIVIEDCSAGRKLSIRRPSGRFPQYEQIIPAIKDGTPPIVSFDPRQFRLITEGFPKSEIGSSVQSISIWVAPSSHAAEPLILVKAHHAGALAAMATVTYSAENKAWKTTVPRAVPRERAPQDVARAASGDKAAEAESGNRGAA